MSKKIVKLINLIFLLFILTCSKNNAFAVEIKTVPFSDKYIQWLKLPEEEREGTIPPAMYVKNIENTVQTYSLRSNIRLLNTSSEYNLLDSISLKIKNQMQTGQCWAFSTTTQLESYMAKVNSRNVEYSPRHMEYSTAKTFLDGTNPFAFDREVNGGGNTYLSYPYMTSGQGPVLESDMPFVNTKEKINLSEISGKTVQAQLEEFIYFPSIYKEKNNGEITYTNGQIGNERVEYSLAQVESFRDKVKEHIMTYGAVTAPTSNSVKFFSNQKTPISSKAYNCDDASVIPNHQITIIGWDDNYAISNFKENEEAEEDHRPLSPGAWIVQNSYGTEHEDAQGNVHPVFNNGILYISYEDCLIETLMSGIISLNEVDYDNIYQYDPLGMSSYLSTDGNEIYMANVFEKSNNVSYLNEVSFYTMPRHTYEIYVNSKNGDFDENLVKIKTVASTDSDYITVKIDNAIKLSGTKFIVAIKYIAEEGNKAMAPIEADLPLQFLDAYGTVTSNEKESYISINGTTWQDCSELSIIGVNKINACIKAFTTNTINIALNSSIYTIGSENKIIVNVLPNTSVNSFKNNLITNGTVKLYDKDGKEITETQIIKTGATLKIDETNDIYKISVLGDINGDGKITSSDLIKLKKHLVFIERLEGICINSADINKNGTVASTDLFNMKQIICKIITL